MIGLLVAGVVIVCWLVWGALHHILIGLGMGVPIDKLGQWGDSFGALSALFAALGFSAVIWTLRLQQAQIKGAEDDLHRQRFESSYFELLKLLREARKDVRFRVTPKASSPAAPSIKPPDMGLMAFRSAWKEARARIRALPAPDRATVTSIYDKYVHSRYESDFGPYFRLLYTILFRIREDKVLSDDEKSQYGNLLRSQLNSYELAIVALNGLSQVSKDFDQLLIEFHFLKYLPADRRKIFSLYYPPEAFAARD